MESLDLSLENLFGPITKNFNDVIGNIPSALFTLVVGFIVIRILSHVGSWFIGFIRMPKGLKEIVISMMDALLTIFLIIVVLQSLGLSNLAFIFSAAIAAVGIALGSGSSTLVSDIIGGIY